MIGHQRRDGALISVDATIVQVLAAGFFKVKLGGAGGQFAVVRPAGRMQRSHVVLVAGDAVCCEFSAGHFSKGRVVRRYSAAGPRGSPMHRRKWRGGKVRRFDEHMSGDAA